MGITIHYEGIAKSEADIASILAIARDHATKNGWPLQDVCEEEGLLERVIDEEVTEYFGRVHGVVLFPHDEAEPMALLFGDDLFTQSYCKTQFAGPALHIELVGLLRDIAPGFESFDVIDEGEYWDSHDEARLVELIDGCNDALAELVRANRVLQIKVRIEGGRIIDALE